MIKNFVLTLLLVGLQLKAQDYQSFLIGDAADVSPTTTFGTCLMGGATENDNAMIWLLNHANGGDIVVLRSSGSDGYNDYMYNQLGVNVNSVETLVINNASGATANYVLDRVAQAEMIWLAGGDQWNYVDYFKDTALEVLLNDHINQKQAPIGGTSAGMAVLGEHYFNAQNGTVTSTEALNDPFNPKVSLGNHFLNIPFLQQTITDTHYDNPVRKGRHAAFIARIADQTNDHAFGIAAEEFTAICIDENGMASVYGGYPNFDDFAYFIRSNCENAAFLPEVLTNSDPLTWNNGQSALKVYKVPGTANGDNSFDLSNWSTGNGGSWHHWWIDNGNLDQTTANPINCTLNLTDNEVLEITIYPNPAKDLIYLQSDHPLEKITIFDIRGRSVYSSSSDLDRPIDISGLSAGIYWLEIKRNDKEHKLRLIKR